MQSVPYLNQIPSSVAAVSDYESLARARLDDNAWAYLHSGAADEITFRANRQAFDKQALYNRVQPMCGEVIRAWNCLGKRSLTRFFSHPWRIRGYFIPKVN